MYRRSYSSIERHIRKALYRDVRRLLSNGAQAQTKPKDIRNVAIVAHVDHGKTTLVDQLLKQGGLLSEKDAADNARVMDSNDMEQERGITILSKCTAVDYKGIKINVIDTPGHTDFGGEVERILQMVDGICLLVDVGEGPMVQTKFILQKALAKGLQPLIVLNKVDRAEDRVEDCQMEVMELLEILGAPSDVIEDALEHTIFASAKNGWCIGELGDERKDMTPLLDKIVDHIAYPKTEEGSFKMLINILEKDPSHGKLLIGRIHQGTINLKDEIIVKNREGEFVEKFPVRKLFIQKAMEKIPVTSAGAGDIIRIVGANKATVTDTLCLNLTDESLASDPIDPPLVSFTVQPNDSPMRGLDGKKVLMSQIAARLNDEASTNVCIKVNPMPGKDAVELCGRGELQLACLVENLRREGFELSVSPPQVRMVKDEESKTMQEPMEFVDIDCDTDCIDSVVTYFVSKYSELVEHVDHGERTSMRFSAPSRALLGYTNLFRSQTRSTGVMTREFQGYQDYMGDFRKTRKGAVVSMETGKITGYALAKSQPKLKYFVKPGDMTYEGMIIGEMKQQDALLKDLDMNPCKAGGDASAVRDAVTWHTGGVLDSASRPSLEESLSWMEPDELVEVTPNHIRLRKNILSWNERKKNIRRPDKKW